MFGALKRGFRSTASLILVRNVVGELQPKRTLAASRSFLAAARLSCYWCGFVAKLWLSHDQIAYHSTRNLACVSTLEFFLNVSGMEDNFGVCIRKQFTVA